MTKTTSTNLPIRVSWGSWGGAFCSPQKSLLQRTCFGEAQAMAATGSHPSVLSPIRANPCGSCSWLCPTANPTEAGLSRDGFQCWPLNNCSGQSTPSCFSLQRSKRRGSPAAWESTYPAALAALPAAPRIGEGKGTGRQFQLFMRNVKGS